MIKEMRINKENNNIRIALYQGNSSRGCNSVQTLAEAKKRLNFYIKKGYVINICESDNELLIKIENVIPAKTLEYCPK